VLSDPTSILYKNFKGFMIGNPVFNCLDAGEYYINDVHNLYWHGFSSFKNFNSWRMLGCNDPAKAIGKACQLIYDTIMDQIGFIDQQKRRRQTPNDWPSVDPDDIFQDFCTGNASLDFINSPKMDDPNAPCNGQISNLVTEYLNRVDVQIALAVEPLKWEVCGDLIYNFDGGSMVPYYSNITHLKPGVMLLVYSGDLDILTVPLGYTLPCLSMISPNIVKDWQPWFINGVTAGYVETYDTFTYATLKGAGHEAPLYQPVSSYQLITRFFQTGHLGEDVPRRKYHKSSRSQSDMLRYYRQSGLRK